MQEYYCIVLTEVRIRKERLVLSIIELNVVRCRLLLECIDCSGDGIVSEASYVNVNPNAGQFDSLAHSTVLEKIRTLGEPEVV